MPTLKQEILELLDRRHGLTDREITNALRGCTAPQQPVNIACRDLHRLGFLERQTRDDGLIGNFLTGKPMPEREDTRPISSSSVTLMSEDDVKRHVANWLEADGWSVQVAWGNARGIDIEAKRGDETWIIEAKGSGSLQPMRVNYFIGMLGETLQRMKDPSARYSIALPDMQQFHGLWQRFPDLAKQRTRITAIFVCPNGEIAHLDRSGAAHADAPK